MKAGKFDSINNKVYFMANKGLVSRSAELIITCTDSTDASKLARLLNQSIDVYVDNASIKTGGAS